MPDVIFELDGARPPQRRRADRFIVGALLSGSLVFGIGVAVARPGATQVLDAAPPASAAPAVPPAQILPTPSVPHFRLQPPIFIPPNGVPGHGAGPLPPPGAIEPRR